MARRLSNSHYTTGQHFYKVPNSCKAYDTVLDLAPSNPLLFRVSHRNSGSFYFKDQGVVASEHYIVDEETGQRYMSRTIEDLFKRPPELNLILSDKLVEHLLYNKTSRTNFVSTTFSFTWALFFAEMNATNWSEEDVELLVIDTFAVAHRAWVMLEHLSHISPDWNRNPRHHKMRNGAYSSQEVIVLDCIPESAIVSRVPWLQLKKQLPSWYYSAADYTKIPEFIHVPNDRQSQKYVRWQKAVQERLLKLSAVSPKPWGVVGRREVISFVLAVLAFQGITDTEAVLKNGKRTLREFEAMVQSTARSLLNWSRGFSSPTLDEEDSVELVKLVEEAGRRSIISAHTRNIMNQPQEDHTIGLCGALRNSLNESLVITATFLRKFSS